MRELTPPWEFEESVYPFKGSDAASRLVAQWVIAVRSSKAGAKYIGLGSNSQGWRARRHLNSVVRERSVYLESVLARLIYRSLCKTQRQALNRTAKTALDLMASLISRVPCRE